MGIFLVSLWASGKSPRARVLGEDEGIDDFLWSSWPARPLAYLDGLALLDLMDESFELIDKPYAKGRAGYESLRRRTDARAFPYVVTKMLGLMSGKVYEETTRHAAKMRLARIGLALLEYRQETGSWPDNLEALKPKFDGTLPRDPYTSKPFYYRRTNSGVRFAADAPVRPGDLPEDYEELVWELD